MPKYNARLACGSCIRAQCIAVATQIYRIFDIYMARARAHTRLCSVHAFDFEAAGAFGASESATFYLQF